MGRRTNKKKSRGTKRKREVKRVKLQRNQKTKDSQEIILKNSLKRYIEKVEEREIDQIH